MSRQPNILFIMADDHAARAIGCYGSGLNETPNIDRIAAKGARLDHCYVTNSICTPSRAAILTGTYNHVNLVQTLRTPMDNRLPNVAKHLQAGGYQTAIVGKWHLGEGSAHHPTGFDFWKVLPGQGSYFDPTFIDPNGSEIHEGYVTDVITQMSLDWMKARDSSKPFFLMCHHKAPHRSWEPHQKNQNLYKDPIAQPETFDDDYKNRARAAAEAKMRVRDDMTYFDLGLVPPGGDPAAATQKIPHPSDPSHMVLTDSETGEDFRFTNLSELANFKYQRYLRRYLQTVSSLDESVGRLLDYLDAEGLSEDTIVIYTSDQGFFLGEHGWYDKRFVYEQSFQMPFLIRYAPEIPAGSVCADFVCNVDFAPTFLDYAGFVTPNYMQGRSARACMRGQTPKGWPQIAYHRYWMHRDATHNAYAHYGIRDRRYKLIYWYNEGYDLPGTREGGQDREWELFDLEMDPLELLNVYNDPKYSEAVSRMKQALTERQNEIGDIPAH